MLYFFAVCKNCLKAGWAILVLERLSQSQPEPARASRSQPEPEPEPEPVSPGGERLGGGGSEAAGGWGKSGSSSKRELEYRIPRLHCPVNSEVSGDFRRFL